MSRIRVAFFATRGNKKDKGGNCPLFTRYHHRPLMYRKRAQFPNRLSGAEGNPAQPPGSQRSSIPSCEASLAEAWPQQEKSILPQHCHERIR